MNHFIKKLEDRIVSFDNWSQPWTFYEFVSNDETLTELEINLFNEIWRTAGDFKFWNNSDLILGCKASQMFIAKQYDLTDKSITNIIRALSYQWE